MESVDMNIHEMVLSYSNVTFIDKKMLIKVEKVEGEKETMQ
jgi:hypothetical protein